MNVASKAVAAAIHCEMKKIAYRQSKDGIVVSFVLHPHEVPSELSTSHIGTRYVVALVEVGDDELPVSQAEKESKSKSAMMPPATPSLAKSSEKVKRAWQDMKPSEQAGIRCEEPIFQAFLKEEYADEWNEFQDAADCVRSICAVESRTDLNTAHASRVIWHQLDSKFQAWKLVSA